MSAGSTLLSFSQATYLRAGPLLSDALFKTFSLQTHEGDMRLTAVYIPTNHVYVGDIYLLDERDIIHTNLTVREGLGECASCRVRLTLLMTG